jgi:hypothetical protein
VGWSMCRTAVTPSDGECIARNRLVLRLSIETAPASLA